MEPANEGIDEMEWRRTGPPAEDSTGADIARGSPAGEDGHRGWDDGNAQQEVNFGDTFVLPPLPPERVATFYKAWDCFSGSEPVPLDDVVLLRFDAPRSATGEDIVEIHSHGSRAGIAAVLRFFEGLARAFSALRDPSTAAAKRREAVWERAPGPPGAVEDRSKSQPREGDRRHGYLALCSSFRPRIAPAAAKPALPLQQHSAPPCEVSYAAPLAGEFENGASRAGVATECWRRALLLQALRKASPSPAAAKTRLKTHADAARGGDSQMASRKMNDERDSLCVSDCGQLRAAEAGEFTFRAYVNGKIENIQQMEALADLLNADTVSQHRLALRRLRRQPREVREVLDRWKARLQEALAFSEASLEIGDDAQEADGELARGWGAARADALVRDLLLEVRSHLELGEREELCRTGVKVVFCGPPNAGKSTFFNGLIGRDTAIVSPIAGTTRDVLTSAVQLLGSKVVFTDTAGLRPLARDSVTRPPGAVAPHAAHAAAEAGDESSGGVRLERPSDPLSPHEQRGGDPDRAERTRLEDSSAHAFRREREAEALERMQASRGGTEGTARQDRSRVLLHTSAPPAERGESGAADPLEREGIARAVRTAGDADILVILLEARATREETLTGAQKFLRAFKASFESSSLERDEVVGTKERRIFVVLNKADLWVPAMDYSKESHELPPSATSSQPRCVVLGATHVRSASSVRGTGTDTGTAARFSDKCLPPATGCSTARVPAVPPDTTSPSSPDTESRLSTSSAKPEPSVDAFADLLVDLEDVVKSELAPLLSAELVPVSSVSGGANSGSSCDRRSPNAEYHMDTAEKTASRPFVLPASGKLKWNVSALQALLSRAAADLISPKSIISSKKTRWDKVGGEAGAARGGNASDGGDEDGCEENVALLSGRRLLEALRGLAKCLSSFLTRESEEERNEDLRRALRLLRQRLLGETRPGEHTEAVLDVLFSSFCVGK
ncbi:hypothetical protein BESB_065040 [Besnoitia besnoiti]|uniref:GTPase n=1 Tax=Besnoitia besnoiti TaxID=94643 RepID=A0A2A9MFP6_BESBE|nr:hypothetical protein BESB_065040 [Besnoitia besnoiti]PFH34473.1 hypothetical protein BESB_065040 [Besnoitia besnoiti]